MGCSELLTYLLAHNRKDEDRCTQQRSAVSISWNNALQWLTSALQLLLLYP